MKQLILNFPSWSEIKIRKTRQTFTFVFIYILFFLGSSSWAYQVIAVKAGGTVPNIDMCAEVDTDDEMNRVLFDFKISEDNGLKDVVVTLEHVEAGKPFNKEPILINSENCKFHPDVNVVRQGEVFKVNNLDAVMHNSQVYQKERGKIITNLPVPPEEITDGTVTFQKHYKIFQMICGMHEFMQTWGYRVQNPYYFITGIDGNFQIDNIPPGDYVVHVWHYFMIPKI